MTTHSELVPLLVVRGAAHAIDFYERALGARVLARYEHGPERRISHADLAIGEATFSVTDEARRWNSDSPESLGGSPVVLQLGVKDAASALRTLENAGAHVVFSLQELLGERMARVRDPFGHLWILRQRIEQLDTDEIQRRRDELFRRFVEQANGGVGGNVDSEAVVDGEAVVDSQAVRTPLENERSIAPSAALRQASSARVHLVLGPVGAGKSTFAIDLAQRHRAVRLTLDDWMAVLFSADRPATGRLQWYVERVARCVEQIWAVAQAVVTADTSVVLELGLIERHRRERFYELVAAARIGLTLYVLDAPRELRRARVQKRNQARGPTFAMVVPPEIFELASDRWEPVDPSECAGRDVRFIDSGQEQPLPPSL